MSRLFALNLNDTTGRCRDGGENGDGAGTGRGSPALPSIAIDVRMAKELGFQPKSLIKNVPSPRQPWKPPVAEWVRGLYDKRQRRSEQRRQRRERAQDQAGQAATRAAALGSDDDDAAWIQGMVEMDDEAAANPVAADEREPRLPRGPSDAPPPG
jgi:hypothetical protein